MMNRYNIAHRCVGGLGVTEDQKGDWVLYDDVINLLGETKTLECNCEEESIKKAEDRNKRNTKRNNGKRNHGCSR